MEEYFDYLDALRESGKVNIFGAPGYLQEQFGLSREQAKDVWLAWTMQFKRKE